MRHVTLHALCVAAVAACAVGVGRLTAPFSVRGFASPSAVFDGFNVETTVGSQAGDKAAALPASSPMQQVKLNMTEATDGSGKVVGELLELSNNAFVPLATWEILFSGEGSMAAASSEMGEIVETRVLSGTASSLCKFHAVALADEYGVSMVRDEATGNTCAMSWSDVSNAQRAHWTVQVIDAAGIVVRTLTLARRPVPKQDTFWQRNGSMVLIVGLLALQIIIKYLRSTPGMKRWLASGREAAVRRGEEAAAAAAALGAAPASSAASKNKKNM